MSRRTARRAAFAARARVRRWIRTEMRRALAADPDAGADTIDLAQRRTRSYLRGVTFVAMTGGWPGVPHNLPREGAAEQRFWPVRYRKD